MATIGKGILKKYPDFIPIIIYDGDETKNILVPNKIDAHDLLTMVRKRIEITPSEVVTITTGRYTLRATDPIKEVYMKHKLRDDCLHLHIIKTNVFKI